jgi:hypothetical protein
MTAPQSINGFPVVTYGFFATPILPKGYMPPPSGAALQRVQAVAICRTDEGHYTFFCTPEWDVVTYQFNEGVEWSKRGVVTEFGEDVVEWYNSNDR